MRAAFPGMLPDEIKRIARASYANLGRTTTETALLPFYDSRHLARPGITGWAQVYAPYGASVDDALQKLS